MECLRGFGGRRRLAAHHKAVLESRKKPLPLVAAKGIPPSKSRGSTIALYENAKLVNTMENSENFTCLAFKNYSISRTRITNSLIAPAAKAARAAIKIVANMIL